MLRATPERPRPLSPKDVRGVSAEVVQRPEQHVDVLDVEVYAAALQQVEEVGPRPLRQLPDRARRDGDVRRLRHVLQHGDRVARQLEDHRELRQGAVQLADGLPHGREVADAPELLRLAQVGVEHERDEAVRVRLRLHQRAVQPQLEALVRPYLDDAVLLASRPYAEAGKPRLRRSGTVQQRRLLVRQRVAAGDAPHAPDVVAEPPGVQTLHVRRRHTHATLVGVPRHLVGAVAED